MIMKAMLAGVSAALIWAPAAAQDTPPDCGLYTYQGTITRVIDGDTVVADIDLGFNIVLRSEHLRLAGLDAPEDDTAEGRVSAAVLTERIESQTVYLCTQKMKRKDREAKGSFGRYLVTIYQGGLNINQWMVDTGHAVSSDE